MNRTITPFLLQIDDVFTTEQCNKLIKIAESRKLEYINSSTVSYYRGVFDDKRLAEVLYQHLREYIPKTCEGNPVVGLNSTFRFSKYLKDDAFIFVKSSQK